jgi:hypothetical protein
MPSVHRDVEKHVKLSERALFVAALATVLGAIGILDAYLTARLYSALQQDEIGDGRKMYMVAAYTALVCVGLVLLLPFAAPKKWRHRGLYIYAVPAFAAVAWLCVGGVSVQILGL